MNMCMFVCGCLCVCVCSCVCLYLVDVGVSVLETAALFICLGWSVSVFLYLRSCCCCSVLFSCVFLTSGEDSEEAKNEKRRNLKAKLQLLLDEKNYSAEAIQDLLGGLTRDYGAKLQNMLDKKETYSAEKIQEVLELMTLYNREVLQPMTLDNGEELQLMTRDNGGEDREEAKNEKRRMLKEKLQRILDNEGRYSAEEIQVTLVHLTRCNGARLQEMLDIKAKYSAEEIQDVLEPMTLYNRVLQLMTLYNGGEDREEAKNEKRRNLKAKLQLSLDSKDSAETIQDSLRDLTRDNGAKLQNMLDKEKYSAEEIQEVLELMTLYNGEVLQLMTLYNRAKLQIMLDNEENYSAEEIQDVLDQLSDHVKPPEHIEGRLGRKSTQKRTKQSAIDKLSFLTRKKKTKGVAAEYTEGPRRGSDEGLTDSLLPVPEITAKVYAPPANVSLTFMTPDLAWRDDESPATTEDDIHLTALMDSDNVMSDAFLENIPFADEAKGHPLDGES
eukprot:GHVQ01041367.1.p1 GENE.GHVQ01041367.1~~GHVQ01041367.1.p1  ORF type:complete len:499 (-),score=84.83 GHVQ01041367.1:356-1852(-)